ncbi:MAG: hypothetical protein ABI318_08585 [Chthoniobacteraceae bacterium]
MKSPARRFTLVMLAMSVLFLGGPVLFNYLVDPYDRFGNNTMGVFIMAEREMKASEVTRYPHNALLIGNSRIAEIPVSELRGFRFFNAAFAAANAEELWWFLYHHARKQELVVLGIDMGTQDPPVLQGDIFRRGDWALAAENLVNLQTLEYSFKTLFSHWSGKRSRYLPDGSVAAMDWGEPGKKPDPLVGQRHLESLKGAMAFRIMQPPRSLTFFHRIADTLRERKIPCVVVMPPMHEAVIRNFEALHLEGECQAWVDEIRKIFPEIVNLTSSPYGAASGFYPRDPVHYKPEVGVSFMNEEVLPFAMKVVAERRK